MNILFYLVPLIVAGLVSTGAAQTSVNSAVPQFGSTRTQTFNRTMITYNGVVCVTSPNYEVMPSGQVIFKHDGMRFDGSAYFRSPAMRDNVVRRNHYESRIIGTTSEFWPPLTPTTARKVETSWKSYKPIDNPYFGSGTQTTSGRASRYLKRSTTAKGAQLQRCPNGSYAIFCL